MAFMCGSKDDKEIESKRDERTELQRAVEQLQRQENAVAAKGRELLKEHEEADRRNAEIRKPAREHIDDQHRITEGEKRDEHLNAKRLVSALRAWQSDAQQLTAAVLPNRPQLLAEVWLRIGEGTAQLLGEQWVPYYESARTSGEDKADWDIYLVPRLVLSRNSIGKLMPWPPLKGTQSPQTAPEPQPGAPKWRLRIKSTHSPAKLPFPRTEAAFERFKFQIVSLKTDHSQLDEGHGNASLEISVQVWRWGGTSVIAPAVAAMNPGRGTVWPGSVQQQVISAAAVSSSDPWIQIFKSKPTNLNLDGPVNAKSRAFSARFERDTTFGLTLLMSPSLGGGTGILEPWHSDGDPDLRSISEKTEENAKTVSEWAEKVDSLRMHGASSKSELASSTSCEFEASEVGDELQECRKMELQTQDSEANEMRAEVEHLRFEYFEACEQAAYMRNKAPNCGPKDWPAAQRFATAQEVVRDMPGRAGGMGMRIHPARPLAQAVVVEHVPPHPVQPPLVSPNSSRTSWPGPSVLQPRSMRNSQGLGSNVGLGSGALLVEDTMVQVFGVCEHAVIDVNSRPRAQVELSFVAKRSSQQFLSVSVKFKLPEPGTLQIEEVEAGRVHEDTLDRLKAVVTRQYNLLLLGVFTQVPVAEVECELLNMDAKPSGRVLHNVAVPLPITITNFLTSLPTSLREHAWDMAKCSQRWSVPEEIQQSLRFASPRSIDEAASCDGTLSQRGRGLTGNNTVFMAELPLNDTIVILALSMKDNSLLDVVVRSEEEPLAKAVLKVAKHKLTELAERSSKPDAVGVKVAYPVHVSL